MVWRSTRTLTGWNLWRWPRSPAPGAELCEIAQSESFHCELASGDVWPGCGWLSAWSQVSRAWPLSAPPSPAVPSPMGLQPVTTGPQLWYRDPAVLLPGRSALLCPWKQRTARNLVESTVHFADGQDHVLILKERPRNNLFLSLDTHCLLCHVINGELRKEIISKHLNFIYFTVATYHKEGLAMKLGLGKAFARPDEPEGDELRVSRLGSSSSINSTSSWSSTSWSRMHLTEYWPNTLSWNKGERMKMTCLKLKQRKIAGLTASIALHFLFYIPAAGPA